MDDREHLDASLRWKAGQIVVCGDDDKPIAHALRSVHIVTVCSCGCAFQSTDAGIAVGMLERHRETAPSPSAVQPSNDAPASDTLGAVHSQSQPEDTPQERSSQ